MAENTTLQMVFLNEENKQVTISVLNPKEDLEAAEVEEAMEGIINQNVFFSTGGDLVHILRARLITRQVVDLIEG